MLKNYIKIAFKVLLRHKLFTFISLFGISFTLLILIIITSLADHTFGKMEPETRLDRTLSATFFTISHTEKRGISSGPIMSYYFFNKYAKTLETPELVSISSFHKRVEIYKENKKFKFNIKYTDAEFWDILDFTFLEGKHYNNDDIKNINQVAVITEDTKNKYFNENSCIGKNIKIGEKNFRIIGVVENVSALRSLPFADIWVPVTNIEENIYEPRNEAVNFPSYFALILAKNKAAFPQIKAEFQKKLTEVEFFSDRKNKISGGVETYRETISRVFLGAGKMTNTTGLMILITVLMIMFMLLPTINLVNINISRIMERSSEIGIRKAFGASSITLVGQFIVENIIITLIGGFIALILALIILGIINNVDLIKHVHLTINLRIFYKSILLCLAFGFISGVYPAFKMSRLQPVEALRGGQS